MRLPEQPPTLNTLLAQTSGARLAEIWSVIDSPTLDGKYLHWQELKHRPLPSGISHSERWLGMRLRRSALSIKLPLLDTEGRPFTCCLTQEVHSAVEELTTMIQDELPGVSHLFESTQLQKQQLRRNVMEEGINSSLLEGASTTRERAREMLRENRAPVNRGEQMVLNNYAAMRYVAGLAKEPLSPETVFQLHEIITRKTLDRPDAVGRFRSVDERIVIEDSTDNEVLHTPPPADQLPQRMAALCDFANEVTPLPGMHPILRAIILHFWLAYDHPFVDGNGRCARALFYWRVLQSGLWQYEALSISKSILAAPIQYARAYLHSERDDNDLTYFVIHQLDIIRKAFRELLTYVESRTDRRRRFESLVAKDVTLNERQVDVLQSALSLPAFEIDIREHQKNHGVVYQTARTDLLSLAKMGYLVQRKTARTFKFFPSAKSMERLKAGDPFRNVPLE